MWDVLKKLKQKANIFQKEEQSNVNCHFYKKILRKAIQSSGWLVRSLAKLPQLSQSVCFFTVLPKLSHKTVSNFLICKVGMIIIVPNSYDGYNIERVKIHNNT